VCYAIGGFIVGYFIFGRSIDIQYLFGVNTGSKFADFFIDKLFIETIRQKILISGVVGGIIGIVIGAVIEIIKRIDRI
jgi:hypothetical protein